MGTLQTHFYKLLILLGCLAGSGFATLRTVDADGGSSYPTLTDAINAAASGDTIYIQGSDIDTYSEAFPTNTNKIVHFASRWTDPDSFPTITWTAWNNWFNVTGTRYFTGIKFNATISFELANGSNKVYFNRCIFSNHTSSIFTTDGNGLNDIVVNNSIFTNNTTVFTVSGSANNAGPYGTAYNSVFKGNTTVFGWTSATSAKTIRIHNSIFLGNTTNVTDADAKGANTYNLVPSAETGWGSGTVYSDDPSFVNASGTYANYSDFAIASGSLAKDAGTSTGAPVIDILNVARPSGVGTDIGAYEYVLSDVTAPSIASLFPADGASRILPSRQPLFLQLDESVQKGTGNITIKKADLSVVENLDITSSQVSVGDAAIQHTFESSTQGWTWGAAVQTQSNEQAYAGTYSLKAVVAGDWQQAETRFSPNSQDWSGFDSVVVWVYSVQAGATATLYTRSADSDTWVNGSNRNLTQNTWTRIATAFNTATDPSKINSFGLNFSLAGTYYIDQLGLKKSGSAFVSFYPSANFVVDTDYFINLDAGAIKDLAGNSFAGIADATTWNFSTNNAPTDITLSDAFIDENAGASAAVGTLSTTDIDAGDVFTYSFVAGAGDVDNAAFAIVGDELQAVASFDYETKASYSVRVQSQDAGGLTTTKSFTIQVTNLNDNAPVLADANPNVNENEANGTSVIDLNATDADNSTLTYSITAGNVAGKFAIDANSGEITTAAALDYETTAQYILTVRVTDGVANTDATITVNVIDAGEFAPVITNHASAASATIAVDESEVTVQDFDWTDADVGAAVSFAITGGDDQALFAINASTGVLVFNTAPDFENPQDFNADNQYLVQVTATDNDSRIDMQTLTIDINNLNDNAPVLADVNPNVDENVANGTSVIELNATDADNSTLTYSITAGNADNKFTIDANSGAITTAGALYYETTAQYILTVRVTDGVANTDATITIDINDLLELDTIPVQIVLSIDTLKLKVDEDSLVLVQVLNSLGEELAYDTTALVWVSRNSEIANVVNGLVSTNAFGSTRVIVQYQSLKDSLQLSIDVKNGQVAPSDDSSDIDYGNGIVVTLPPADTVTDLHGVPYTPAPQEGMVILGQGISFLDSMGAPRILNGSVKMTFALSNFTMPEGYENSQIRIYVDTGNGAPYLLNGESLLGNQLVYIDNELSRFFIAVDTLAPELEIADHTEEAKESENATIDFDLLDNISNAQLTLYWKIGGDTTTYSRTIAQSEWTQEVTLLAEVLSDRGAMAWLEAADGLHITKSQKVDLRRVIAQLKMDKTMAEERYDLFSLPYMTDSLSVIALLESQLGNYDPKKWRCYRTEGSSFVEVTSKSDLQAGAGQAYWLRTRNLVPEFQLDSMRTYAVSESVQVELKPGWNSISTPYHYAVDWNDVLDASELADTALSGIYAFDADNKVWSRPDTTRKMEAWAGVVVRNNTEQVQYLKIPAIEWQESKSLQRSEVREVFTLRARQGAVWQEAYAVQAYMAKTAMDAGDYLLPPQMERGLRISFPHRDWGNFAGHYMMDSRATTDSIVQWDFEVAGLNLNEDLIMELQTSQSENLWLVDQKTGKVTVWKGEIHLAVGHETVRQFSLVKSTVAPTTREQIILSQAQKTELHFYGNGIELVIPESLESAKVNLNVIHANGAVLQTLIQNELLDAGVYQYVIDETSTVGARIVLERNGVFTSISR